MAAPHGRRPMTPRPTLRPTLGDWASLLSLVLMWGTAFVFIRLAVSSVSPIAVAAGRIAAAAVLLFLATRLLSLRFPPPGGIWLRFAVLAVIGNGLPFFLVGWGQQHVASSLTGILMAVNPLATLVLAHWFVPGEPMTRARTLGFLLGFAGVVTLMGPAALLELGGGSSRLGGQVAILTGALCYAANSILARRLPPMHPLVASAAVLGVASLFMVPAAFLMEAPGRAPPSTASLAAVVWLGAVPTALATLVYFRVVASAGPTFLSQVNYGVPLVALLAGVLVYQEEPGWNALVALALILAGIAASRLDLGAGLRSDATGPEER
jgi:drug/metabolite transporter (DMT)-like permease